MKKQLLFLLALATTVHTSFASYPLINKSNQAVTIVWDRPWNKMLKVDRLSPGQRTTIPFGEQKGIIYPANQRFDVDAQSEISRDSLLPMTQVNSESGIPFSGNKVGINVEDFVIKHKYTGNKVIFHLIASSEAGLGIVWEIDRQGDAKLNAEVRAKMEASWKKQMSEMEKQHKGTRAQQGVVPTQAVATPAPARAQKQRPMLGRPGHGRAPQ